MWACMQYLNILPHTMGDILSHDCTCMCNMRMHVSFSQQNRLHSIDIENTEEYIQEFSEYQESHNDIHVSTVNN